MLPPGLRAPSGGRVGEPPVRLPIVQPLVEGLEEDSAIGTVQAPRCSGDPLTAQMVCGAHQPSVARKRDVCRDGGMEIATRSCGAEIQ
jgi:hypothetical protein